MKHARKFFLVTFTLVAIFVGSAFAVNAAATVSEIAVYCNFAQASGTSTAPYVTLYVYDDPGQEAHYIVVPVTNGTWTAAVSFPEVPLGNLFLVQAFGTTAPLFDGPTYYDGEAYFESYFACEDAPEELPVPIVVTCSNPLPADAVVYEVPNGATAYFNPDLQSGANFSLPAGSWKISEVSGDFAKVWIACEAESIWILSSTVGGAVG